MKQVLKSISFLVFVLSIITIYPAATTKAASYYCGSQCNDKDASWAIPSNGIRCANSAKVIDRKTQSSTAGYFIYTTYYSTSCQTIWANFAWHPVPEAASLFDCTRTLHRFISPTWSKTTHYCAGTTHMVNDYSASGGKAATISFKASSGVDVPNDYSYSFTY